MNTYCVKCKQTNKKNNTKNIDPKMFRHDDNYDGFYDYWDV